MSVLAAAAAQLDLPLAFTRTWVALLGLVAGSFLNVVIHRVPRGESIVRPRSRCPGCGSPIRWHQNLPVASWLLLRGRCASCGIGISWRYPAVELLAAGVFVLCHEIHGFTPALAFALPFAAALLALIFIDAEHLLLPDAITLPLTFVALALSFVSPLTTPEDALLGVLLSWGALEGMNLAYKLVRGRDGFGGGDTKMMMMVGAVLGWQMALLTLVLGSFLGVLLGIPALALSGRRERREAEAAIAAAGLRATEPAPVQPAPTRPSASQAAVQAAPQGPDAACESASERPDETAEARPSLRELLPQSLDETLPLLIVPACALTWVIEGASPQRTLAGLLIGTALAVALHAQLRRRGLQSPASRALPLLGAFAGWPASPLPLLAALLAVAAPLLAFRPPWRAPHDGAGPAEEPAGPGGGGLQWHSELPFGVFLGIAALAALLWGEPLLDWYWNASALFGGEFLEPAGP